MIPTALSSKLQPRLHSKPSPLGSNQLDEAENSSPGLNMDQMGLNLGSNPDRGVLSVWSLLVLVYVGLPLGTPVSPLTKSHACQIHREL